jgi:hypothetical protein
MFMKKLIWVLWLCLPVAGFSQTYSIDWFKIAGGGGTSTGGTYVVSGTIGQPDASGQMSGGSYSVTGGFWGLIAAVQTAGAPLLTITRAGNNVQVSWANTGSFTLQTNGNLTSGVWANSSTSVNTTNGINSIIVSPPAGNLFFRLKQ